MSRQQCNPLNPYPYPHRRPMIWCFLFRVKAVLHNMFTTEFLTQAPAKDKDAVQAVLTILLNRYHEPHRFYHNLTHIELGLKTYSELFSVPLYPLDFFAWAYHDTVYDSTQSNNEQKSADLFLRDAKDLGFNMEQIEYVMQSILSTNISEQPVGVINDIDLSGLGSAPEVYAQNTRNIRKEYHWVEPEVWRTGRTAVLRQLLKKPTLYLTKPFAIKFTDQAIQNMTQELQELNP